MNRIACIFFITVISLISACKDYPGSISSSAVVAIRGSPTTALNTNRIQIGGDCHIDSVNNELGESTEKRNIKKKQSTLKVAGWNVISVIEGHTSLDTYISLKSRSNAGLFFSAKAVRSKRSDVAEFFKNPKLMDSGFTIDMNLSDVEVGEYLLEIIQTTGDSYLKCPMVSYILVE